MKRKIEEVEGQPSKKPKSDENDFSTVFSYFSKSVVKSSSTEESYKTGKILKSQNLIRVMQKEQDTITGVASNDILSIIKYKTKIVFENGTLKEATCDCGDKKANWCSHIVGTSLIIIESPQEIFTISRLEEDINSMKKEEIKDFLIETLLNDDDLLKKFYDQKNNVEEKEPDIDLSSFQPENWSFNEKFGRYQPNYQHCYSILHGLWNKKYFKNYLIALELLTKSEIDINQSRCGFETLDKFWWNYMCNEEIDILVRRQSCITIEKYYKIELRENFLHRKEQMITSYEYPMTSWDDEELMKVLNGEESNFSESIETLCHRLSVLKRNSKEKEATNLANFIVSLQLKEVELNFVFKYLETYSPITSLIILPQLKKKKINKIDLLVKLSLKCSALSEIKNEKIPSLLVLSMEKLAFELMESSTSWKQITMIFVSFDDHMKNLFGIFLYIAAETEIHTLKVLIDRIKDNYIQFVTAKKLLKNEKCGVGNWDDVLLPIKNSFGDLFTRKMTDYAMETKNYELIANFIGSACRTGFDNEKLIDAFLQEYNMNDHTNLIRWKNVQEVIEMCKKYNRLPNLFENLNRSTSGLVNHYFFEKLSKEFPTETFDCLVNCYKNSETKKCFIHTIRSPELSFFYLFSKISDFDSQSEEQRIQWISNIYHTLSDSWGLLDLWKFVSESNMKKEVLLELQEKILYKAAESKNYDFDLTRIFDSPLVKKMKEKAKFVLIITKNHSKMKYLEDAINGDQIKSKNEIKPIITSYMNDGKYDKLKTILKIVFGPVLEFDELYLIAKLLTNENSDHIYFQHFSKNFSEMFSKDYDTAEIDAFWGFPKSNLKTDQIIDFAIKNYKSESNKLITIEMCEIRTNRMLLKMDASASKYKKFVKWLEAVKKAISPAEWEKFCLMLMGNHKFKNKRKLVKLVEAL